VLEYLLYKLKVLTSNPKTTKKEISSNIKRNPEKE
jgi:hypothetical protein